MNARGWLCALLAIVPCVSTAQPIADIRQGTNLTVALAPDGQTLVTDLLGQLWTLPATGGAAQPLMAAGDVARNPRFAPNGREVVFQARRDGQWDLRVLDLATGASLALTATPFDEREPDFTADGRSVVFASNRTGRYCLWRLDIATGVVTQLTEEPGDAAFPAVGPSGEIAYVRENAGTYSLRVLDPNGAARELVATTHALAVPSWRPGGGVLVFREREAQGASVLKLMLLSEPRVIKPLTRGEDIFDSRPAWASPAEFVYAADGQVWRRGIADAARRPVHLFAAVAVDTHAPPVDVRTVPPGSTHTVLGIADVAAAADGRRIVFTALGDLWLAERGRVERLTDDIFVEIDPTLSPDGESIVFASDRAGNMHLWRLQLATRSLVQLTFDARKSFAPSWSPEGRRLAYLSTGGLGPWDPSELRVLDLAAAEPRSLTRDLVDARDVAWDARGATVSVVAASGQGPAVRRSFDGTTGRPSVESRDESAPPAESSPFEPALEWRAAQPPAEPYVIEVGRLFDGVRSDYRRHVDVHVAGGRIAAIVGRGTLPAPGPVIDARDATVVPGFIDVHAHHSALGGERLGRAWLAYGVTTVRELTADVAEALERGESWASGRRLGPRLAITPLAGASAPHGATAIPLEQYPGLADGFAHNVLRQARELGIPRRIAPVRVPRFLTAPSGPRYELEISPLHASYQDNVSRIITSGTVTGSALGAVYGLGSDVAGRLFVTRDSGYRSLFAAAEQELWTDPGLLTPATGLGQTLARLIRAGGRVAIGSDAPAVPYGLGLHYELALLAEAGIPNDQILRLATAEGAIALGLEREIGTLEEGKIADLVVLRGDPLARIADSLTITAIVAQGAWHDRAALLAGP